MIKLYWIEVVKGYRIAAYIAFICFAVSIYKVSTVGWFLIHASSTQGEVVLDNNFDYGFWMRSSFDAHFPVVKFSAPDGSTSMVVGKTHFYGEEIEQFKKSGIKVFYNPYNLKDAKLDLFEDLWYFQACLFFFGLLVISIDYWIFLFDAPLLIHKQDNVIDFNNK